MDEQQLELIVSEVVKRLQARPTFPGIIDPISLETLRQYIGIKYTTTVPTHTPTSDVEVWIYFDATDTWIYVWSLGAAAWKSVKLT